TYEQAAFISKVFSPDDERRRELLVDLVTRYPRDPQSVDAYLDLMTPAWKPAMHAQYPDYVKNLIEISAGLPLRGRDLLLKLATNLREIEEPTLELQALRQLKATQPVGVATLDAMQRLISLTDASDPDHVKLVEEMASMQKWRAAMAEPAKWYLKF